MTSSEKRSPTCPRTASPSCGAAEHERAARRDRVPRSMPVAARSARRRPGRSSSFVRCDTSAIPTAACSSSPGIETGTSQPSALLEGGAEVALRALDRGDARPGGRRRGRRRRRPRGSERLTTSPSRRPGRRTAPRCTVIGTARPFTWTSKRPPSTARSFGTIARPITLPSSALRRTLVTRPDDLPSTRPGRPRPGSRRTGSRSRRASSGGRGRRPAASPTCRPTRTPCRS